MKQNWFISLFACLLLTNCQSDYQTLLLDEAQLLQATLLFEKDSNNYIYDIKATETHLAILNQENDTMLTVYEEGKYDSPVFVVGPTPTGSCNLKIHYSMYATVFNTIAPKKRFMRFRSDLTCLILFIIIIHPKVTIG